MSRLSFLLLFAWGTPLVFCASISGEITDPMHHPVPGVRLTLFQGQRSIAGTVSDAGGRYSFDRLSPGIFLLSVNILGFQQEFKELRLESGQSLKEDIILHLKSIQENVVVTATRTETPTSLLGNSVSVITAEEIHAQNAVHVSDLLRSLPGMTIVQTGGRGGITSIFLRGAQPNYTKVFLDGIPLNQPGGDIDLANLSTANIERIEVVRGPQSALYGSDAIGGVIQIFTQKVKDSGNHPSFSLSLEGGKYRTGSASTGLGGVYRNMSYSSEFRQYTGRNQGFNNYLHNQTVSARLGIAISSKSSFDMIGHTQRGKHGVPGPTAFGPADLDAFTRKRDFALGMNWNYEVSNSWRQRLSYSHSYSNQLSENPIDSGCFTPQFAGRVALYPYCDYPYSALHAVRRQEIHYQNDFFLSSHVISVGMEWENQQGTVGTTPAQRTHHGYYLQDQFLLLPRLAVTGGLRLEDNQSFGFAAVPRVSVAYLLRNGSNTGFWGMTRAKVNYGLGIKEPSLLESYSPNRFYRGNPNLKPEKSRSYEMGLEQLLANQRIQIEADYFFNRFEDQIALKTVDPITYDGVFFNIGKSQAWGVEQVIKIEVPGHLRLAGGHTYMNTRVIRSTVPYNPLYSMGAPLLRRPAHSGFMRLTWDWRKWLLHADATLVGRRTDGDFYGLDLITMNRYTKVNFCVGYKLMSPVELYMAVENLLNQGYFEVQGFPASKIDIRAGLRFRPWK